MPEVTITHDGQEISIPLEAVKLPDNYVLLQPGQVPDGFVPETAVGAKVNEKMKHAKRTLSQDSEFVQSLIKQHVPGIQFEDGRPVIPKGKDVDVDKIRESILAEMVNPLKAQMQEKDTQIERLLGSRKRSEILQAAMKAGVREEYLKPATGKDGDPTIWENMVSGYLGFDPDHDMFAVKEGEGFAYGTGEGGKPWAGVGNLHERLRKNDAFRGFFNDRRPGDTGLGSTGGASGSSFQLTREQARDPQAYRRAKEQADKAGKTLQIVD